MDKRESVWAALHNQKTDHIPASVWFHMPEAINSNQSIIDIHVKYFEYCNVDFMKIMSDGFFAYPVEYEVKKAGDLRRLAELKESHSYFINQIERARKIVRRVKGQGMVFYNIFAPFSSLRFALGDQTVMKFMEEDEAAVQHALTIIAEDNARLVRRLIKDAECDGIYFCVQGGEKRRFTAKEYTRLITPSDLYVLKYANEFSSTNILHCCGWDGIANHLECWQEYPAIAVNWAEIVEGMDLTAGKKFFQQKAVMGGFRNTADSVLAAGTKVQIREETEKILDKYKKLPGTILGADCSFAAGLDFERIRYWMEIIHS